MKDKGNGGQELSLLGVCEHHEELYNRTLRAEQDAARTLAAVRESDVANDRRYSNLTGSLGEIHRIIGELVASQRRLEDRICEIARALGC